MNATMAAARLTSDSSASDSRPTEPVMAYAPPLSTIVARAATIEMTAYRRSEARCCTLRRRRQHPQHLGDRHRRAAFGPVVDEEVGGNPGVNGGLDEPEEILPQRRRRVLDPIVGREGVHRLV